MMKRCLALLLSGLLLTPSIVLAQSKAGVVTTLEGNVSARRVALPDPVSLKFKDDVFLQDTVTTGDKSLARMLLGGKAVVTVRERSVLTLTEVPGRSTIELDSGKFALAVAREKMRPGEEIQIRTPNAIAGVRGTVVVTEVNRQSAQTGGGAPAVLTNFYVLRGTITAQQLDPGTKQPLGAPLNVGTLQSYSQAGGSAPRVAPVPPERVGQITSGLQPQGPKGGGDAGKEQVKTQALQTAVTLLTTLTGGPGSGPDSVQFATAPPTGPPGGSNPTTPQGTASNTAPINAIQNPEGAKRAQKLAEDPATAGSSAPSLTKFIALLNSYVGTITVSSGLTVATVTGTTINSSTVPLFTLSGGSAVSGDDLISFFAGSDFTTSGPLLSGSGVSLATGGSLVSVQGKVTSTTSDPFVQLTSSSLIALFGVLVDGGSLTLGSGPLLSLASVTGSLNGLVAVFDGTLKLRGPAVTITNSSLGLGAGILGVLNGTLTATGTDPLVQIAGSTIASLGDDLIILGDSTSSLTLAGPLATLTNSSVQATFDAFFESEGVVKSTTTSPFITFGGSTVAMGGEIIRISGGSLTLAGPLLNATNSIIGSLGSALFIVTDGATVTSTTTSPLVTLLNTLVGADNGTGGFLLSNSATMNLAGPLVSITNAPGGSSTGTSTAGSIFAFRSGGKLTDTGSGSLISISGSKLATGGNFIGVSGTSTASTSLSLQGSLLVADDSVLRATSTGSSFFSINDAGSITVTNSSEPLFKFTGTVVGNSLASSARNFFVVSTNLTSTPGSLTLSGPLLTGTRTDFKSGDPTSNTFTFFFVGDSAKVTSTSTLPLMTLTNSTVDTAGDILTLRRSQTASTPSSISLAGPLLVATNSAANTTSLGFASQFSTSTSSCCAAFFVAQGAELKSTTTSALIQLTGSTFTLSDSQSGGSFFSVRNTFSGAPSSELVSPATVSLAGPLLSASTSTITPLFNLLQVVRSSVSSTTTNPLVSLTNSTVTAGGTDVANNLASAGRLFHVFSADPPDGTSASPASLSLAGPLLSSSGSVLTAQLALGVFGGGTVTSTTTSPLVSFTSGSLTLNTVKTSSGTFTGEFASVGGTGGSSGSSFATLTLAGPLLSVTSPSTLTTTGPLVRVSSGGQIVESHATDPFVLISGGTHTIASASGSHLFDLSGRSSATTSEVVSTSGLLTTTSTLTLGTDQPLQRSGTGAFFELAAGTTVSINEGLSLDTALVSASAPLLNLKGTSSLTSAVDGLNLVQKAKLTTTNTLVKLDGGTLTITSGHAIRLGSGSFLNVGGDLFLINGGKLDIKNGAALFVGGDSVVKVSGALVNFNNSTGNLSIASTTNCTHSCLSTGGIQYLLQNGASSSNISVTNGVKNSGSATINVPINIPVVILNGANSKLIVSGN